MVNLSYTPPVRCEDTLPQASVILSFSYALPGRCPSPCVRASLRCGVGSLPDMVLPDELCSVHSVGCCPFMSCLPFSIPAVFSPLPYCVLFSA